MAIINVLNINVNILIKVILKKRVNTKILKDKILYKITNIYYIRLILAKS